MSVQRGLFLRRLLAILPAKRVHSRAVALVILLVCAIGVGAVSTDLILSGLAARLSRAEKISSNPPSNKKLSLPGTPASRASSKICSAPLSALQACTLGC